MRFARQEKICEQTDFIGLNEDFQQTIGESSGKNTIVLIVVY